MRKFALSTCVLLPVSLTIGVQQWWDTFHILPAALLAVLALVLVRARSAATRVPPAARSARRERTPKTKRQPFRLALGSGLLVAAAIVAWHGILVSVPVLRNAYVDRDRRAVEASLDQLEAAGQWERAAHLAENRLADPLSGAWMFALSQRAYFDLVQAAAAAASPPMEERLVASAMDTAQRHQLSPALVQMFQERQRLRHELAAATTKQQDSAAAAAAKEQQLSAERTRHSGLALEYFAALLRLGNVLVDTDAATASYDAAQRLAEEYGLDRDQVAWHRSELARKIARRQPIELPRSSTATIVGVATEHIPPTAVIDVAVRDAQGQPLHGLAAKDFRVTNKTGQLAVLAAAETTTQPPALQLGLLMDASASTSGAASQAAQRGALQLLDQLPATGRVYAFGSSVTSLTSWTSERSELAQAIKSIRPIGQTAMFQGLDQVTRDLAIRNGVRSIILFTDGHDTVGGASLDAVLVRCREQAITVHVVALETAELDAVLLRQITERTGGLFLTAASVAALPQRFDELRRGLRQPVYRLVVPTNDHAPSAIHIRVGGQSFAQAEWTRNGG